MAERRSNDCPKPVYRACLVGPRRTQEMRNCDGVRSDKSTWRLEQDLRRSKQEQLSWPHRLATWTYISERHIFWIAIPAEWHGDISHPDSAKFIKTSRLKSRLRDVPSLQKLVATKNGRFPTLTLRGRRVRSLLSDSKIGGIPPTFDRRETAH